MHVVETNTPAHGAAYRVLYERLCPADCGSLERFEEMKTEMSDIVSWAGKQSSAVFEAYTWAAAKMTADLTKQLAHVILGNAVQQAFMTIPKPPSMLR